MKKNMMPLGAIYDIVQGTYLKKQPNEDGVLERVIRIQNLTGLELGGEFTEEELAADKVDRFRVQAGQIVVTLRGMPLKASVVGEAHAGFVINSNFAVLTAMDETSPFFDPFFVAGLLRSEAYNHLIMPHFVGSTLPALKISQLKQFEIPVVSKEVQQQLGQVFRALERYQSAVAKLLQEREAQVEAYIGQLMQGGVVQ